MSNTSILGRAQLGALVLGSSDSGAPPPSGQTITPTSIASTTTVRGVKLSTHKIKPTSIASTTTVRGVKLSTPIKIKPTSIASTTTVRGVKLAGPPQSVYPGSISTTSSMYGANVFRLQKITVNKIPATTRVFAPKLTGGDGKLHVYVGGVEITPHVTVNSASLVSTASGRWTATIYLVDPAGDWSGSPLLPTEQTKGLGVTVVIIEANRKIFSGFLNAITIDRPIGTDVIQYQLDCLDLSGICDHKIISGVFQAGTDVAQVVRSIWASALYNEGINLQGVPTTLDSLPATETFNYVTVTQAFDRLAADINAVWWVDENSALQFNLVSSLPAAPFNLTETSRNWRKPQVQVNLANYRNKQYVVSNLSLSPSTIPSVTETYTLPQPAAVAAGFRLAALVLNFPVSAIISIKVNGTEQPWQNGTQLIDLDKSWWSILGQPYLYGPDSTLPSTPTGGVAGYAYPNTTSPFPAAGDTVQIEYIPDLKNANTYSGTALEAPPALALAGSGIFEAVDQVNDISSPTDLSAIAQAILTRKGFVPFFMTYETDNPNLRVGQRQTINIPKMRIPSQTLTITKISGKHLYATGSNQVGHGSGFRWTVEANSGSDFASNIKRFELLVQRTQHPLPVVQYAEATFVLSPGGSISDGVVSTNPQIVSRSGRLVQVVAQAGVPPTGQNLTIDVIHSLYGSIFASGSKLVIPDGSSDLVVVTAFISDPLWVLVNQSFTVKTSYSPTSGATARAGSVTVKVRWSV
jgi:hypothetical protein